MTDTCREVQKLPTNPKATTSKKNKPNHITENTRHISTVGPDGSTIKLTSSSIHHDGEEVHKKTVLVIRLPRSGKLEAIGDPAFLRGSK